jgi:hypothetical protein
VGRALRGERPGELSVKTRYESAINLKTAKPLGRKRSFLRTYAVERGDGMRCPP